MILNHKLKIVKSKKVFLYSIFNKFLIIVVYNLSLSITEIFISIAIISSALVGYSLKRIDFLGAITGIVLAFFIWYGGGEECLMALFLFFIFGSIASSWKLDIKNHHKLAQENDGKRSISNVFANGGVAGILSACSLLIPEGENIIKFMIIASFATACSDTFSSEFGNIYGKKYYNIISFKQENRGVDGAVSFGGLLFGLIGSSLIAISTLLFQFDLTAVILIFICGLLGNLFDSILGASFQKDGYLNNHQVNFWATLFGSMMYLTFSRWLFS